MAGDDKGDLFPQGDDAVASPAAKKPVAHYHGHRQRLREKFLKAVTSETAESLADYELLELLLFLAIPQKDVKPLAKDLLERFGSLGAVFAAHPESLVGVQGIKENAAIALKVVHAASLRMIREDVQDKPILSSWERMLDYCHAAMAFSEVEEFRLLFLDRKNCLIRDERQQRGTVDQTPIYAREVVKRALELHACAVIMVHNHPSGDPQPSPNDIATTHKVREALRHVDIVLHDHLIVSRTGYCSFKQDGLL
jgi:DNA repair protein RadC